MLYNTNNPKYTPVRNSWPEGMVTPAIGTVIGKEPARKNPQTIKTIQWNEQASY
jgi:hypothetical protein